MGQGQTKFQCLTVKLILMVASCVRSVSEGPVRQQWAGTKFQCLTGKLILMVLSSARSVSEGPVRQQWGRDRQSSSV